MLKFNRVRWTKVAVLLTTAAIMILGVTMFVGCDADRGVRSSGESVTMFVGCDADEGVYSSGESVTTVQSNITSQPESDNEDAASMYTWDDAYGQEIMDKAANTYTVKSYLDNYESQGYTFAPEYSFVMEGYGIPDGGTDSMLVQFVTLAMTYTPDPTRQAMYVTFTESELGFIIAPYLLSFVEPDPSEGFSVETDGIWRLDFPAEVGHYCGRSTDGPAAMTPWDDYWDCVKKSYIAGCAAVVVGCLFTGPGYPECVAGGCVTVAVAGLIGCAFSVWG